MTSTGGTGEAIERLPNALLVRLIRTMYRALNHGEMARLLRLPADHPDQAHRFPADDAHGPDAQAAALGAILDHFDQPRPEYLRAAGE